MFQRRRNGQQDFNMNWDDYKNGFGDLKWEFWLGLEKIYCLTTATCRAELRVDLGDNTGRQAYAIYDYFALESEMTKYKLRFGAYSGTAGDSFRGPCGSSGNLQGMPFSTLDRDNDNWSSNCAQDHRAGWWFNSCYCSNLNKPYNPYISRWYTFSSSLKCTEMKLRSRD